MRLADSCSNCFKSQIISTLLTWAYLPSVFGAAASGVAGAGDPLGPHVFLIFQLLTTVVIHPLHTGQRSGKIAVAVPDAGGQQVLRVAG